MTPTAASANPAPAGTDRRRFLGLTALGLAACALRPLARGGEGATSRSQSIPESAFKVLAQNLSAPEGPSVLADGRVAFVARPGNVIAVAPDGTSETLASSLGLVVGTRRVQADPDALLICRMDPARLPKMGGAPSPAGGHSRSGAAPSEAQLGGAILRLDLATRAVTALYTHSEGSPLAGPNKMVADEWGDLWITDVFDGVLYWARADGSAIRRAVSALPGAHGITLSPDRRTVYVSSDERMVSFRIATRGELEAENNQPRSTLVAQLNPEWRVDGIRTQADGNIVMACWGEGMIVLSPAGKVLSMTKLAGLAVTNFVFGGTDRHTIYATTNIAGAGPPGPGTGKVIALRWPQPGSAAA
jgi:gluconolactonase